MSRLDLLSPGFGRQVGGTAIWRSRSRLIADMIEQIGSFKFPPAVSPSYISRQLASISDLIYL
jgi:hypothetical protein